MYNNFFTNCYIKKFLPLFGKFARLAGKNRLSEQTSKHPSLRPAPGCWQLFCQNRQASTNSYVSCTSRHTLAQPALLSEQTSKQVGRCVLLPGPAAHTPRQNRQASTADPAARLALGNFCQNRQASSYPQVIHSLWLVIHRLRQDKEAADWISKGFGPCFFELGPRTLVPGPYRLCF